MGVEIIDAFLNGGIVGVCLSVIALTIYWLIGKSELKSKHYFLLIALCIVISGFISAGAVGINLLFENLIEGERITTNTKLNDNILGIEFNRESTNSDSLDSDSQLKGVEMQLNWINLSIYLSNQGGMMRLDSLSSRLEKGVNKPSKEIELQIDQIVRTTNKYKTGGVYITKIDSLGVEYLKVKSPNMN